LTSLLIKSQVGGLDCFFGDFGILGCFFDQLFTQVQVLFDFPAFVPVFLGFFGLIISFAEGMFAITYGFDYRVQGFCHNYHTFLEG
jgi:hypothetical protein